ncbi:K02A2.6-like [Cordylochernes scorpioides]|uniref:K02A2.6-like n=1 Tax=Cordylochernes scorpioides TaxID=51811 RepID=A0ABY6LNI9_9ARAC|nr:K02A2.6-like [Cordylochernes scorpioides]
MISMYDEILPFITHAYNTTIQETTGYSPFFLLFGREPMSLLDDDNIPPDSNMDDYDEYIENYLDKIARTRQVVINNTEKTQERLKRNYDKKHIEKIYEPGHLVAVWTPVRKIGKCEKLLRKYFGPYRILKKLSNVNYLIEPKDNPGQDPLIVHRWLWDFQRVARYNKWDDSMCLANVIFYLTGTAKCWFENFEEILNSWEEFKIKVQTSGENVESYIQEVLLLCKLSNPRMSVGEKVSHLIKGVAEEVYQALVGKGISTVDQFVAFCRRFEAFKRMRVAPPRFNRLPNVTTISTAEPENLEALI